MYNFREVPSIRTPGGYAPAHHPELVKHARGFSMDGRVHYIACDNCIAPETKGLLTHFPDSWKEPELNSFSSTEYEPLKM